MSKQSQLDKAIAALEADRAVLDLAIAKLRAQQPHVCIMPKKSLQERKQKTDKVPIQALQAMMEK